MLETYFLRAAPKWFLSFVRQSKLLSSVLGIAKSLGSESLLQQVGKEMKQKKKKKKKNNFISTHAAVWEEYR